MTEITPMGLPQRRLPFNGAANFRDLGGYEVWGDRQTRWRRVYRSDSLADLTEADLLQLADLELHTLVDFRLPHERRSHPDRLPAGSRLTTIEIGFWPDGVAELQRAIQACELDATEVERAAIRFYRNFPLHHNEEYGALLTAIERAKGRPLLFHCVSGRDRTGYAAAVLLLALGATRETILQDYALSDGYRRDIRHLIPPGTPDVVVEAFVAAKTIYLEAALDAIIERYGSEDAYLERGLDFGDKRRSNLRDLLTESRAQAEAPTRQA